MDSQSTGIRQIAAFVERIRAERDYWSRQTWDPPPEPPPAPMPERYRLEFRPGHPPYQPAISVEEARKAITDKIWSYAYEKRPNRVLLIRAQPGIGKTHLAVEIAQQFAENGTRILYAMPTHAHFETLANFPHFRESLWYHWLALHAESPATGNTMCLYPEEMTVWTQKGYNAMALCDRLCPMYKPNCEYRRQQYRTEPIVAGVHNHIALGMQISNYWLAFIDELPLKAFISPRHIPSSGLDLPGSVGPLRELTQELAQLTSTGETYKGKVLLDLIGPLLEDVYAQFEDLYDGKLAIPWISRPEDVKQVPYWYLEDLLTLLVQEWQAWEKGAEQWLERVIISPRGMDLLQRAQPWERLPARVVILDATGNEQIYRQIFGKNIETFAPNVKRKGRIYQIVNRLNGIGTMIEKVPGDAKKKRLSKNGLEALQLCKWISAQKDYKRPGAVTFMDAVPEFEEFFGAGRVLYFHNQRGSNDLLDCDAGFVVGAPQPKDTDLMKAVKILYPMRTRPFTLVERDGAYKQLKPARGEELRPYVYFDERGQAWRMISGFWNDRDLNTMADVFREQEIVQAIHRFRPISRDVPIYVLTSIPTSEILDGIYEDPREILDIPGGISNWEAWMKLVVWLRDRHDQGLPVTYDDIAEATGLPETTVRRWKWLDAILEAFPDLWQVDQIAPKGGRPKRAIMPCCDDLSRGLL